MTQDVLGKLAANLKRLRQQLAALGDDIKFGKAGGQVFYAVDFLELYSFLNPKIELPEHLTAGLFVGDRGRAIRQLHLGLTHLFQTVTDTVYLLPPHVREMWSYVQHWSDEAEKDKCLLQDAWNAVSNLTPKHQELLQNLAQHGGVPDKHEFRDLIELVKGEFGELCLAVFNLTTRQPALDRLTGLRDLVKQGHLSYRIEEMLGRLGVNLPSDPEEEVVNKVFVLFPPKSRKVFPLNKGLDTRALLYLDLINQSFDKLNINAKLLFITRDQGIVSVAEQLEHDPGGPRVCPYLRSVDAILFDLMLRGVSDEEVRLKTIMETDDLLANLERSVNALLDGLKAADNTHLTEKLLKQRKRLIEQARILIEQAQILWDEHVNLRLSQTMPVLPWLQEALQLSVKPTGVQTVEEEEEEKKINLLRVLWDVVVSPEYQKRVKYSVTELIAELLDKAMRSLFFGILSSQSLDTVMTVFTQIKAQTALRSRRYTIYVSLHFISSEYQLFLAELSGEPESDVRYDKAKEAFIGAIQKVITETEQPSEAEGFLFMAFVLGLLDFWEEADKVAARSVELAERNLHLMSVDKADDLVNKGRNLVIVALVDTKLYIRIFDANGKKVVDKAENKLTSGETLTTLKKQLNSLPNKSSLSPEQKQKIIQDAILISGHYLPFDRMAEIATEVYYFRAVLNRKIALTGQTDTLDRLKGSFGLIMKAIGKNGWKDPRFLKELATIVLQYHHFSKIQGHPIHKKIVVDRERAEQPADLNPQQAMDILLEALPLTQGDRRLRVEILNNLAYIAVHNEEVLSLDKAESYVAQMMQEFAEGRSDQPLQHPPELWPALEDTKAMINAKRCQHDQNRQGLEEGIVKLKQISEEDLSQEEQTIMKRHLNYVQHWVNEIDVSDTVTRDAH